MTNSVPWPQLADAVRDAYIPEAIWTLRRISDLAIAVYRAKVQGDDLLNQARLLDAYTKIQTMMARCVPRTDKPHPLLRLIFEDVRDFLHEHVQRVVAPIDLLIHNVLDERDITRAEEWIVRCAIHPDVDADGTLHRMYSQYLEEQPRHALTESPKENCMRQISHIRQANTSSPSFPGLQQALHPFVSQSPPDSEGISVVLRGYMSLGFAAAELWAYKWQNHGIRRGEPFAEDDDHATKGIRMINEWWDNILSSWQSEISLHVRRKLSEQNLAGDFLFLANHIFPTFIAPHGRQIRENEFTWEMQRMLVTAATAPDMDPDGCVAEVIRLNNLDPEVTGSRTLYRNDWLCPWLCPHIIHSGYTGTSSSHPSESGTNSNTASFEDVMLVPYGPRNDVHDYTTQQLYPHEDASCTICLEEFGTDIDESSCRQLATCEHLFHWECLHDLINSSHTGPVRCPNCRSEICEPRKRRVKEE
jgi:hypothetical protein